MRTLLTLLLLVTLRVPALASEDLPSPWSSVSFKVPRPGGDALVEINGLELLSKVVLTIGEHKFEVPTAEFDGIDAPQLHTAQLLFGAYWHLVRSEDETPPPYYLVQMRYGREQQFGEYPLVQFLFHDGKYQERQQKIRSSGNTWRWIEKPIGSESAPSGTTTRLTSPKENKEETEQDGADQPATAPESKPESDKKPNPESEERRRAIQREIAIMEEATRMWPQRRAKLAETLQPSLEAGKATADPVFLRHDSQTPTHPTSP